MIQLNLTRREIHLLAMALTEQLGRATKAGLSARHELVVERKDLLVTLLELVK